MDTLSERVTKEYQKHQPSWKNVQIRRVTPTVAHGTLVTVSAREGRDEVDDVCFVDSDGSVRIFDTYVEMAEHLGKVMDRRRWIASPEGISAIAFLVTLVAVIAFTTVGAQSEDGLKALIGILGLAAGFFFGNQAARK